MQAVEVIEDAAAAGAALDPVRSRLLHELAHPASAAALASRMGLPRQKVNYHLRSLEAHGLVRETEQRRWGGLTERLLVATAESYVVSPTALGAAAARPEEVRDRLSAGYLIALAARIIREVGALVRRAAAAEKRLATLSIDTEIHFASAADRAEFTHELTRSITELAARYHQPAAAGSRAHRLVVVAHPLPRPSRSKES